VIPIDNNLSFCQQRLIETMDHRTSAILDLEIGPLSTRI